MQRFDCIVAGCGAVGSAAAMALARRGCSVLALDPFAPGHDRGSSHGESRVIRKAYFEHPDYVPLLERAYELWAELEAEVDEKLYHETGVLQLGPASGEVIPGVRAAAARHGLAVEEIDERALSSRFPGFRLPDGSTALFEQNGGYLRVEAAVRAQAAAAERRGARLHLGERLTGMSAGSSGVEIRTATDRFGADALIIAAGAWSSRLLGELGVKLTVLRKHLHWFDNQDPAYREDAGAPVFFYEIDGRFFYGFPQRDELGVKLAEHTGGEPMTDPDQLSRSDDPAHRDAAAAFLARCLPGVSDRLLRHDTCMYTMSPDGHFIVDDHPGYAHVCFAAGLSGHGFKFAPVLGELLALRALGERPSVAAEFLELARFGA